MIALIGGLLACDPDVDDPDDTSPDGPLVVLGFPLPRPDDFTSRIGVDHDPVVQEDDVAGRVVCTDFAGRAFPHCYDEHHGSDYLLDGGFEAMDAGSSPIVAAADGIVVDLADGNYDRCHADLSAGDVSC